MSVMDKVAALLTETNEIMADMPWFQDSPSYKGWTKKRLKARIRELETEGLRRRWKDTTITTGLPVSTWRLLYGGGPSFAKRWQYWNGEWRDDFSVVRGHQ